MTKPKIRCPSCGSSQAYLRRSTGQIACPECGDVTPFKGSLEPMAVVEEKKALQPPENKV